MLKQTSYQLHNYKIVEESSVSLQWEKHSGFGVQQSGRCYVIGNVLITGEPINEERGCLVGEFFDQLRALPCWSKTKYYCKETDIIAVSPVKSGSNNKHMGSLKHYSTPNLSKKSSIRLNSGSYRLGVYRIIVNDDLTITWIKYIGNGRIAGGIGEISGDILLLTKKTFEEDQGRQQFQMELKSLPLWPFTDSCVPYGAASLCIGIESPIGSPAAFPIPNQIFTKRTALMINDAKAVKGESVSRSTGAAIRGFIGAICSDTKKVITPLEFSSSAFSSLKVKQGVSFIRKFFSGKGSHQKAKSKIAARQSRGTWKAKIAGALIAFGVIGAFIVIFFHHEIESVAHLIHHGGHSRAHQSGHHSNH